MGSAHLSDSDPLPRSRNDPCVDTGAPDDPVTSPISGAFTKSQMPRPFYQAREYSHMLPGVGCGHSRGALFSPQQVPCEKSITQRKKEQSSHPSNPETAAAWHISGRRAHLPTLTQTLALSRKLETGRSYKQGSATPALPTVLNRHGRCPRPRSGKSSPPRVAVLDPQGAARCGGRVNRSCIWT